ncbi:MAG: porin, partial [Acidithiobacillus sp.]
MKVSKNGYHYKIISLAMLAALPMMIETGHASPLALPSPLTFNAGPLGTLNVQGVASGYGVWQDNKFAGSGNPGNKSASADISNGMVIIQKNTGLVQFYLQ